MNFVQKIKSLFAQKQGAGTGGLIGGAIAVFTIIILANVVKTFITDVLGNFSSTEQTILNVVVTLMLLGVLVVAGMMGYGALKGRRR